MCHWLCYVVFWVNWLNLDVKWIFLSYTRCPRYLDRDAVFICGGILSLATSFFWCFYPWIHKLYFSNPRKESCAAPGKRCRSERIFHIHNKAAELCAISTFILKRRGGFLTPQMYRTAARFRNDVEVITALIARSSTYALQLKARSRRKHDNYKILLWACVNPIQCLTSLHGCALILVGPFTDAELLLQVAFNSSSHAIGVHKVIAWRTKSWACCDNSTSNEDEICVCVCVRPLIILVACAVITF